MQITNKMLKEKNIGDGGIEWFNKYFEDGADHTTILNLLEKQKTISSWMNLVIEAFKLSGTVQCWYDNDKLWKKRTYINGKLHGPFESWHFDGGTEVRCNYINGKLHGCYEHWNDKGEK